MEFTLREVGILSGSALALGLFEGVNGAPFLNAVLRIDGSWGCSIGNPYPIHVPNRPEQASCSVYVFGEQDGHDVFLNQSSQYEPVIAVSQQAELEPLFAHPQGSPMTLPVGDISSGRIYVHCAGEFLFNKVIDANGKAKIQPAPSDDAVYNFVEFTVTGSTIYVDTSAVDMVSNPPLGYKLEGGHTGKQVFGPRADAVESVCTMLKAQSQKDGQPWDQLCVETNGKVTRVLSPGEYMKDKPQAFEGYFTEYAKSVYKQWAAQPHTFDLGNTGKVTCAGSADGLSASCNGKPYALPTSADVFGCASGPFTPTAPQTPHEALRAPLCAAFNRGTALTDTDPNSPRNWYSEAVHNSNWGSHGYAFPFDDVRVGGKAQDGTLTSSESAGLTINVGGNWPPEI